MSEGNKEENITSKTRSFFGMPAKLLVSLGQLLCVFVFAISIGILILLLYAGFSPDEIGESERYVETEGCGQRLYNEMRSIGNQLRLNRRFQKDGILNGNMEIDITHNEVWQDGSAALDEISLNPETSYTLAQIQEFYNNGYADKLEQLYWDYQNNNYSNTLSGETLEEASEYTYDDYGYYSRLSRNYLEEGGSEYTKEEMQKAVDAALESENSSAEASKGNQEIKLTDREIQLAKRVQELSSRDVTTVSDAFLYLFENGEELENQYAKTVAGETLAEYAARSKGDVSLQELYSSLMETVNAYSSYISHVEFTDKTYENSNLRYYIKDDSGNIFTNVSEWRDKGPDENLDLHEVYIQYQRKNGVMTDVKQGAGDTQAGIYLKNILSNRVILDQNETVYLGLDTSFPYHDDIYQSAKTFDTYMPWARMLIVLLIVSVALWLILLVLGTIQSGHNAYDDTIRLYKADRMPSELTFILGLLGIGIIALGAAAVGESVGNEASVWVIVLASALASLCYGIGLAIYYSIVRRIKGKNLWRNSILHSIVSFLGNIYAERNTSTKLILLYGGFVFLHFVLLTSLSGAGVMLCLIMDVIVLFYLIKESSERQSVLEGLKQIGSGDMDYKVSTVNLNGDNLKLAETVNNLGEGLQAAVNEKMKSERLKADLITNVSHDIKTPLTSIINYVDLLKRENLQEPRIKGYIDILDAKSQRLKQLTEDLVEASKVSSGNIRLEFITLNINELVQQMNGEFDERFHGRDLAIVTKLSGESLCISADGRRMWRVLENLYVNVVKYAMPGTRVYIETGRLNGKVFFTMKNVSENPLNIDAKELTERFIRGDVSRSSEGSGLGLSIAQNLTRLQHGSFDIYLDGDLFKVTLMFEEAYEQSDTTEKGTDD